MVMWTEYACAGNHWQPLGSSKQAGDDGLLCLPWRDAACMTATMRRLPQPNCNILDSARHTSSSAHTHPGMLSSCKTPVHLLTRECRATLLQARPAARASTRAKKPDNRAKASAMEELKAARARKAQPRR